MGAKVRRKVVSPLRCLTVSDMAWNIYGKSCQAFRNKCRSVNSKSQS